MSVGAASNSSDEKTHLPVSWVNGDGRDLWDRGKSVRKREQVKCSRRTD